MASVDPVGRAQVEFEIAGGGYHAAVGRRGATLLKLERDGSPLVDPVDANEISSGAHGQVLAPWPNRLRDGAWTWEGVRHVLPVDEPSRGQSANHGLVRWQHWERVRHLADEVAMRFELAARPGYPFPLTLECRYRLSGRGLHAVLTAYNVGDNPAPVALGAHPYLMPDCPLEEAVVIVPASLSLPFDAAGRPGALEPVKGHIDLRHGRRVGSSALNHTFTGMRSIDGRVVCEVRGREGTIRLWASPTCTWIQVYTGDGLPPERARRSIAIEPMTAPPQALATGHAITLPPKDSLSLEWGIEYVRHG